MKSKIKKRITCLFIILFTYCFIFSINNTILVRSEDNYSNYLYNQDITINNDKAMILQESASSSNNYRNYFESNFLFPAKLSNQMFNAFDNTFTQYDLSQIYLDNLDNDYAFTSSNDKDNIYYQQNLNIEQLDLINGSLNGFTYGQNQDLNLKTCLSSGTWISTVDYVNDLNNPNLDLNIWTSIAFIPSLIKYDLDDITLLSVNKIQLNLTYSIVDSNPISSDFQMKLYNNTEFLKTWNLATSFESHKLISKEYDISNAKKLINPIIYFYANSLTTIELEYITITVFDYSNTSIILPEITESGNNYKGLYSFTNDVIGSNPTDWTVSEPSGTSIQVISTIDSHDKVVELYDASSNDCNMYNDFSSQTYGTIEFWFRTDNVNKFSKWFIQDSSTGLFGFQINAANGKLQYYDGSYHDSIQLSSNIWYHIQIDFRRAGAPAYKSLNDNKFQFTISETTYGQYSFAINSNPNRLRIETYDNPLYFYIDAIDYSWSDGYYENRNMDSSSYIINIDIERLIDFQEIVDYSPVFLDLYFKICANYSANTYVFDYNYDILTNDTILYNNYENEFHLQTFRFNESGQYRLNKFRLFLISQYGKNFELYIKSIYLNITYIKPILKGYQDISIKSLKEKDDTTYIGFDLFHIKIYKTYFSYYYIENNLFYDNYVLNWHNISYNDLGISSIETFELNYHIRYGLNTLDVEITNIKAEIYINSELSFTFIDQDRKSFDGKHYRNEYNYTCYNRNYLNLTGVVGNYSYNTLSGIRCLCGQNDIIYNRFFTLPLFSEKINVAQKEVSPNDVSIPDEPELPSGTYWTYETYKIASDTPFDTKVGNWTISFTPIKAEKYTAKYPYNSESYNKKDFGDWTFKIGDWKISFNFIRDVVCKIVNLIILFFQYIGYFIIAALSYVFMFLGCYILVILFDVVVYYLFIALCYVIWYLLVALIWIWNEIIIPFLAWCYNVLLPLVIDWIIIVIAFLLTCFIYVLVLGQIDFWTLYYQIYDMLWKLIDLIVEWITIFATNYLALIEFLYWYLLTSALLYFNYVYSRARGFQKRAERLYYTLKILISPILFIWNLLIEALRGTPEL